ncbi:cupin domain-containing protein [Rhizobium leucaenae]|uniref:Anti-sigma factor ChrR (Cupin superfamily) n=1 Tax=Rhizobium leucaenae TaxID=29450 RepID=A0A7W7EMI4_9HYPH|nr:cupin domain-containing protein [Rhizobium leucaenae]MBB4569313.1 anti-sigma factor ChrR (cupin superfamily) [Rhizobium leucaenae]MBB6302765.1 anti-sigma factor ChrR (cupin superfamily) [Rhizobium leucaenae]
MLLNDDLSGRAIVHAARLEWLPSPVAGVDRRMLFRIGGEKARATSIVRYAAGSRFSHHEHPGGEEFLVLDGVFQDESGNFPAGTYVRNPPGTGHAPGSEEGCVILVKLWQFKQNDREGIVRLPGEGGAAELRNGVISSRILFEGAGEHVMLEDWQANADIELANPQGLELLVIDGSLTEAGDALERWSWLRLPPGQRFRARVGQDGVRVWYQLAPLLHDDVCVFDGSEAHKDK